MFASCLKEQFQTSSNHVLCIPCILNHPSISIVLFMYDSINSQIAWNHLHNDISINKVLEICYIGYN